MKEKLVSARNQTISFLYTNVLKKVFFKQDPETVHDRMVNAGKLLGKYAPTRLITRLMFDYQNPDFLSQKLLGIEFKNPIGLSAGFDKNAELIDIMPCVGFSFVEVGSITGEPCEGNPKPRLWRLPKTQSLIVNYGLKNDGAEAISKRLKDKRMPLPVGISVAKTNNELTCDTQEGIKDYHKAYNAFAEIGAYYTINISCPNTFGGQPFTDKERLDSLFAKLLPTPQTKTKPVFIKLSPDLSYAEVDQIIEIADKYQVDGFVVTNLTKNRINIDIKDDIVLPEKGGFSGKLVENLSNELISYIYTKTKGKFLIIGCGGVFTAEDAYKKIKLGASLIQIITGMIFGGPQTISQINQGLVKLLQADGYKNISEAIGKEKA